MPENRMKKPHILTLDNRKLLTLSGVEDVSGFDEQTINVKLSDATLVVKGAGLHISKLSLESGDVVAHCARDCSADGDLAFRPDRLFSLVAGAGRSARCAV